MTQVKRYIFLRNLLRNLTCASSVFFFFNSVTGECIGIYKGGLYLFRTLKFSEKLDLL